MTFTIIIKGWKKRRRKTGEIKMRKTNNNKFYLLNILIHITPLPTVSSSEWAYEK